MDSGKNKWVKIEIELGNKQKRNQLCVDFSSFIKWSHSLEVFLILADQDLYNKWMI